MLHYIKLSKMIYLWGQILILTAHLFNMTFAQLQYSQIIISLSVIIIESQSQFETLICQGQVPYALWTHKKWLWPPSCKSCKSLSDWVNHLVKDGDVKSNQPTFWDFFFSLTHHSNMAYVVPDICLLFVIGHQSQSPLKRGQRHVVLLSVETAQAQVVVQLAVIHAHLEQPSSKRRSVLNQT